VVINSHIKVKQMMYNELEYKLFIYNAMSLPTRLSSIGYSVLSIYCRRKKKRSIIDLILKKIKIKYHQSLTPIGEETPKVILDVV